MSASGGGVCSGGEGGVPGPGGRGCAWSGGVWPRGGVSAPGGVGIPACIEAEPPPVNRMTNRCKNITAGSNRVSTIYWVVSCHLRTKNRSDMYFRFRPLYFYRPHRSWGKVIFSQASVILSTGGACVVAGGGRGHWGACVVAGGHAWLPGGMHSC